MIPGHEWKLEVGKACFNVMLICDSSFGAFCRGVFAPIVSIEEGNRSVSLGWLDGDDAVLFVGASPGSFLSEFLTGNGTGSYAKQQWTGSDHQ